jgi:hypothetical protein
MSLFSAMSVPIEKFEQPSFSWSNASIFHSLYYVVFMFVASLCSIQLFIGVSQCIALSTSNCIFINGIRFFWKFSNKEMEYHHLQIHKDNSKISNVS